MRIASDNLQQQIKIFLSLGGLFFFGPYVLYYLKHTTHNLSQEDKKFISSYAYAGFLAILLALVSAGAGAYDMAMGGATFAQIIYTAGSFALVALFLIGSILVFTNTRMPSIREDGTLLHLKKITQSRADIIKSYLPCYNFYLRYKVHQFSHPFWWLKESLLWTLGFLLLVWMFHSVFVSILFVFALLVRVITLLFGYDVVPDSWKVMVNRLFVVNVEELWGDVKGVVSYMIAHLHHTKTGPKQEILDIQSYMKQKRSPYVQLYTWKNNPTLIFQYVLWAGLMVWWIYSLASSYLFGLRLGIEVLAIVLVLSRYIVMIPYGQYPLVPVLYEISDMIMKGLRWIKYKRR